MFTTTVGTPFESHNLRRDFRKVTAAAGLGSRWVPKELRTSFVSMMSYQGVPVEEIARLAGHASSRTTGVIYRRKLRPVITTGAEIMDQIFRPRYVRPVGEELWRIRFRDSQGGDTSASTRLSAARVSGSAPNPA